MMSVKVVEAKLVSGWSDAKWILKLACGHSCYRPVTHGPRSNLPRILHESHVEPAPKLLQCEKCERIAAFERERREQERLKREEDANRVRREKEMLKLREEVERERKREIKTQPERGFEFQFRFGEVGELSVYVDVNAADLDEAIERINNGSFEDRIAVDPDSAECPKVAGVLIGIPEATEMHVSQVYGPLDADDCRNWTLDEYRKEFEESP